MNKKREILSDAPTLKWQRDYTAALANALRHWVAASRQDDWKFYASYIISAGLYKAIDVVLEIFIGLLYVTEYTRSRVVCLRLEGNLVLSFSYGY